MQSVLKSCTPVIKNGVHDTWTNSENQTYYRFDLEWENGEKGQCLSTKPGGNYEVGKEYTYEKKENNGRLNFNKIKSLDAAARSGNWSKGGNNKSSSYYENPEVQKRITSKLALEWASKYLSKHKNQDVITEEKLYILANNMFIWCWQDVDVKSNNWNNKLLDRRAAMEISVEQVEIQCLKINLWADLVSMAEKNYKFLVNHGQQQPAV